MVWLTLFVFFYLKIVRDALTETSAPSSPVILSPENPPVEEEVARIELEDETAQQIEEVALSIDEWTETPDGNNGSSCTSCSALKCENRKLRNQEKSLQSRLRERRKDLRKTRSQGVYLGEIYTSAFLTGNGKS